MPVEIPDGKLREAHKYCPDAAVTNRGSYRDVTVERRGEAYQKGGHEGDRYLEPIE